jgi:CRP/FNR family transcriptional regulator, cyclic AMP receptor protein
MARTSPDVLAEFSALRLFDRCSTRQLKLVARLGTRVRVPAGRKILVAGTRSSEFMVLMSGRAQCLIGDTVVALFEAGDFFGEVAALAGGARTATVSAIEDSELLVLEPSELDALLAEVPTVTTRMAEGLASRLRRANELAVA